MENPFYSLQQDRKRAYISKMVLLLILSIVFFFGIWLNLNLLRVGESTKSISLALAAIILLTLTLVQTVVTYHKAKKNAYYFYNNRIEFQGKSAYYGNIDNVYLEKKFFDRFFNTGAIVLHPYFKIKNIKNSEYMLNYIKQLVQRAKQVYY